MNAKIQSWLLVVAMAGAGVVAALLWLDGSRRPAEENSSAALSSRRIRSASNSGRPSKRSLHIESGRAVERHKNMTVSSNADAEAGEMESDDEALLKEEEINALVMQLKEIAKVGNIKRANKLIAKIKELLAKVKSTGNARHCRALTHAVHSEIVGALALIGGEAIPEMLEYVADEFEDVSMSAIDQLTMSLRDPALGDYDRAQIVAASATALTDARSLDLLFTEIFNMRHSVAVGTIIEICNSGTVPAREKVIETMQFFTGDASVTTPEALEAWLVKYPDTGLDGLIYGPMKSLLK